MVKWCRWCPNDDLHVQRLYRRELTLGADSTRRRNRWAAEAGREAERDATFNEQLSCLSICRVLCMLGVWWCSSVSSVPLPLPSPVASYMGQCQHLCCALLHKVTGDGRYPAYWLRLSSVEDAGNTPCFTSPVQYLCMSFFLYVSICLSIYLCLYLLLSHTHARINRHTQAQTPTRTYIYVCVCVCVCVRTRVCSVSLESKEDL